MGIIGIEEIRPGMILEKDLRDRSGLILLGAGQEITEKHLKIFKMWGIVEADIQGVTREETLSQITSQIDPLLIQEVESQLREEFKHTNLKHPFIQEIFRLVTLKRVLKKSGKNEHDSPTG